MRLLDGGNLQGEDKTVDWEKVFLGRMNEWQQPAFFGELCSAQWEGRSNLGFYS
jgi:hypothetical protein